MDSELIELRRIAEAATRGPWAWSAGTDGWGDCGPNLETVERGQLYDDGSQGAAETIVGSWGHDANGITVEDADAQHIATFDPPTVLALIDRLEAAERARDASPEPQTEPTDALDLEALEAKAKAATPGPWMLDGMGEDEPAINYWAHRFIGTAEPNETGSHEIIATSEDGHGPNAEYIAAADPKTVLALIAALRAASAVIEQGVNR